MKAAFAKFGAAALLALHGVAFAAAGGVAVATPAGLWQTIDDKTEQPRSLVRISESGGVYTGHVEKSLTPGRDPSATCTECTDERKGQPLIGLVIIRNIVRSADDATLYDRGDILDPDNGKVYRARLKPLDDGRKLQVRGYLGPFYRTQTWVRVE